MIYLADAPRCEIDLRKYCRGMWLFRRPRQRSLSSHGVRIIKRVLQRHASRERSRVAVAARFRGSKQAGNLTQATRPVHPIDRGSTIDRRLTLHFTQPTAHSPQPAARSPSAVHRPDIHLRHGQRKSHGESASFAVCAFHRYRAAEPVEELSRDAESEAGATELART